MTALGELVRRLMAGIILCGAVVAELQVLHIMQLNVEMCWCYLVLLQQRQSVCQLRVSISSCSQTVGISSKIMSISWL